MLYGIPIRAGILYFSFICNHPVIISLSPTNVIVNTNIRVNLTVKSNFSPVKSIANSFTKCCANTNPNIDNKRLTIITIFIKLLEKAKAHSLPSFFSTS